MKKYILLPLMAITLFSCRLDDNISPNEVQADAVTPDLRLSAASTDAYAVLAGHGMNELGNVWTNAWAGNNAVYGNPYTTEMDLNITTTFYQGIFNDGMRALAMFQQIIQSPQAQAYPNYVAIAKIQKAYYMQYLVDLYGDIPYSEAFQETENVAPKYDDDVAVYQGLINELFEAKDLITQSAGNSTFNVKASSDPIFHGDMSKWEQFANTVLLKFAIHLSNTTDADGIAMRNNIISQLSGASFITDNVTINPGYDNSSAAHQNPLYNSFGLDTFDGKVNQQGYYLMTMSDHAVKTLLGDTNKITSGVADPRITEIMTIATDPVTGNPEYFGFKQGQTKSALDATLPSGFAYSNANFSKKGGMFATYPEGASSDGYVMMLAESELLQAEAALRGYAGFSSAQTHFKNAVQASFDFYNIDPADFNTYYTDITGKAKVGWTSGNTADNIAAIQYQRWVALINYNGIEAYINSLRTGYPQSPLALTATETNRPYRLMYPASEYSRNGSNTPEVSQAECFSINAFTPFIYK